MARTTWASESRGLSVGDIVRRKGTLHVSYPLVLDGFVRDAEGRLFAAVSRYGDGKGLGCDRVGRFQKWDGEALPPRACAPTNEVR